MFLDFLGDIFAFLGSKSGLRYYLSHLVRFGNLLKTIFWARCFHNSFPSFSSSKVNVNFYRNDSFLFKQKISAFQSFLELYCTGYELLSNVRQ